MKNNVIFNAALHSIISTIVAFFLLSHGHAALLDEEQVYTGEINDVGEWGLELHVNRTLKGINQPTYLGERVNANATRLTPEFSLGLSKAFELGLYLPMIQNADGKTELAGHKWRLKWLPIQAKDHHGWFAGLNTEISQLKYAYSDSSHSVEFRSIFGWQNDDWLFATNPVFGWALSRGYTHQSPEFTLGLKVAKRWSEHTNVGFEYYDGMGRLNDVLASTSQDRKLYLALEHEGEPLNFHAAIGRGLNSSSDAWTIKTIFEFSF